MTFCPQLDNTTWLKSPETEYEKNLPSGQKNLLVGQIKKLQKIRFLNDPSVFYGYIKFRTIPCIHFLYLTSTVSDLLTVFPSLGQNREYDFIRTLRKNC